MYRFVEYSELMDVVLDASAIMAVIANEPEREFVIKKHPEFNNNCSKHYIN